MLINLDIIIDGFDQIKIKTSWAALESNSLLSWNFWSEKFLGPKNVWVQKQFLVQNQNNVVSKKRLGPKKLV